MRKTVLFSLGLILFGCLPVFAQLQQADRARERRDRMIKAEQEREQKKSGDANWIQWWVVVDGNRCCHQCERNCYTNNVLCIVMVTLFLKEQNSTAAVKPPITACNPTSFQPHHWDWIQ